MKDLIEIPKHIYKDYYIGIYTTGERHDLIKEINTVLQRNKIQ